MDRFVVRTQPGSAAKRAAPGSPRATSPRKKAAQGVTSLEPNAASDISAPLPVIPANAPSDAAALMLNHLTDPGWHAALSNQFRKTYFTQLADKVAADRAKSKPVYPPAADVFAAFNTTPMDAVRVVIIGQDPYHGPGQGHGLCFSVRRGVQVPPSLKNIYKELTNDIEGFVTPPHGNLESWAQQGVFLLNATLTVRGGEANSHEKYGWQEFTDAVIRVLNAKAEPIVFILWGGFAKKKGCVINRNRHCVIEAAHPSPLSVTKFMGCKSFSKANAWLVSKGRKPIDWQVPL